MGIRYITLEMRYLRGPSYSQTTLSKESSQMPDLKYTLCTCIHNYIAICLHNQLSLAAIFVSSSVYYYECKYACVHVCVICDCIGMFCAHVHV